MNDPKSQPGYETRDTKISAVAWAGIAFALVSVLGFAIVTGVNAFFESRYAGKQQPVSPLAVRELPPEPRLQIEPDSDWQEFKAVQDSLSSHYGWVLKEAGLVRIPIDSAMGLSLERGFKVRPDHQEWRELNRE